MKFIRCSDSGPQSLRPSKLGGTIDRQNDCSNDGDYSIRAGCAFKQPLKQATVENPD